MVGTTLLTMEGIDKSFSGTQVLHGIDLDVRSGEVHALMGENGAGKSTLMKVLAGIHAPDAGRLAIGGDPIVLHSPGDALRHGIGIIHQELNVVPDMSVAENLALGHEPTRSGVLDRRRMLRDAKEKLATVGASFDPRRPMRSLSIGMQQLVEIARAVAEDSKILILDEPTAALSTSETRNLFSLIERMRLEGMGLIYISHRMEEVWEIADRVTVMRDGRRISTRERAQIAPHDVVTDMIGRELEDLYSHEPRTPGSGGLAVRGVTDGAGIGPVDFDVRDGEIVGMFGLIGAGRSEIARLVFGADRASEGVVSIDGERADIRSPHHAIRSGIGLLSEDRKSQGIVPERGVLDNIALPSLHRFQRGGVLRRKQLRSAVREVADRLRIRRFSLDQSIAQLSGGNQQKALFARWIEAGPRVLILDEPTRGVDIGAKSEIYRVIDEIARRGVAVLMISSDLPEVIGMSDRVLVVREGAIVADIPRSEATERSIMLASTGVSDAEAAALDDPRFHGTPDEPPRTNDTQAPEERP